MYQNHYQVLKNTKKVDSYNGISKYITLVEDFVTGWAEIDVFEVGER